MKTKPAPRRRSLSLKKRIAFSLLAAALPLVALVALELLLRALSQPAKDPFLQYTPVANYFSQVRENGRTYVKYIHPEAYKSRTVVFPLEKDAKTFRVFCLGSSASAGWPHPPEETYSTYLQEALAAAYPGRTIEVNNLSMHAFPSFRVRMIFEQALKYQPDLFIIYCGNNEFLEARHYSSLVDSESVQRLSNRLLLVHKLRSLLAGRGEVSSNAVDKKHNDNNAALKNRTPFELRAQPDQCAQVIKHYTYNIETMVAEAGARGIPAIVLTVPVNLRDWRPHVSWCPLEGAALQAWQKVYDAGRRDMELKKIPQAVAGLREAVRQAPTHAQARFDLARALELAGRFGEAYEQYQQASDLDYGPLRAISADNDALRQLAARHPNASLADMVKVFAGAARNGLPGFDLFLDHVHPTKPGHLLLARTVYDQIIARNLLGGPPRTPAFTRADTYRVDGRLYDEERDLEAQGMILWVFGMLYQDESIPAKADFVLRLFRQEGGIKGSDNRDLVKVNEPFVKSLHDTFSACNELRRKDLLGIAVPEAERAKIMRARQDIDKIYN